MKEWFTVEKIDTDTFAISGNLIFNNALNILKFFMLPPCNHIPTLLPSASPGTASFPGLSRACFLPRSLRILLLFPVSLGPTPYPGLSGACFFSRSPWGLLLTPVSPDPASFPGLSLGPASYPGLSGDCFLPRSLRGLLLTPASITACGFLMSLHRHILYGIFSM